MGRIFPKTSARLLARCLKEWPVRLGSVEERLSPVKKPVVSILLAIGGADRLAQFKFVLASLLGQSFREFEIVVVEQSHEPSLKDQLPSPIVYHHDYKPETEEFNKSRAMNIAARIAKGELLCIHDADYVVPARYVDETIRILSDVDVARPGRFIFYMSREGTISALDKRCLLSRPSVDAVVQNNPTPFVLRKSEYWGVGGHDESFVGWGGEDVEFLSRLRSRSISEGGVLPIVHLWHPPAPRKASGHRNQAQQDERLNESVQARIDRLTMLQAKEKGQSSE